ncbi:MULTISPECIES: hypothetical protein [Bacillaceae]|uniref:hypothetical protein n=1 Tax=Bacillaceae TaxID=186817 RepID=UPI001F379BB6|nr:MULTISPECIES: hypothetical protein [Bacillaceae]MCF2650468.1 hypothetical protein [Niallia circulans]CAI9389049.1 hypothetical protein BACSP_02365 [Bacillus sp. T2.9-1]
MKRIHYKAFSIALFPIILLLIGCTEKVDEKTDEYIQAVDAVLHNALTGPDDTLKDILELKEGNERSTALTEYEDSLYKDYFASETAYNDFISRYGTVFMTESHKNNYILAVENIEYERTHSKENIYNFSIQLQYQKEGKSQEVKNITGQADLNDEQKIERMLIRVNDLWGSFPKDKRE